jgi:recombination protein RecR
VVERATDILPIERSGAFRGRYHALGGRLSPLEHVGPEDLSLPALSARLQRGGFSEVILALSTDVEGEATANYLVDVLAPCGVKISRLAQGMPAGGGLEHADELTLARAMAGRQSAGRC